jgi:hypothetical protein
MGTWDARLDSVVGINLSLAYIEGGLCSIGVRLDSYSRMVHKYRFTLTKN